MRFDSLCHKNGKEGQISAAGYPAESFLSKFALRIYKLAYEKDFSYSKKNICKYSAVLCRKTVVQ